VKINIDEILKEEMAKPKEFGVILYFQKDKTYLDKFGRPKCTSYVPTVERAAKDVGLETRLVPNTPFEENMGIEIISTDHQELVETANQLHSKIKEKGIPTRNDAEIVIDPNGLFFDLSYGHRENERKVFQEALGVDVVVYGKNRFMVKMPIEEDMIPSIIKALEKVRNYILKKQKLSLLKYYNI